MVLTETNSIANHFIAELRNVDIQKDSMRFRQNMTRIGEIIAYEISKTLTFRASEVPTSLGIASADKIQQQIVLAVVLRAGLPFYQGFLNYFDTSESAFIAAYRGKPGEDHSFDIKMDYVATPSIEGKVLILIDPMLATGGSLLKAYETISQYGKPAVLHIASVISSVKGLDFIKKNLPEHTLWTGAVDKELNAKFYIVPGLGDAGDIAFGGKI